MSENPQANELTPEKLTDIYYRIKSEETKFMREVGEFMGIRIFVDPTMPPNDWKIVCGVEAYAKFKEPLMPLLVDTERLKPTRGEGK